jgi:hypothetical protein
VHDGLQTLAIGFAPVLGVWGGLILNRRSRLESRLLRFEFLVVAVLSEVSRETGGISVDITSKLRICKSAGTKFETSLNSGEDFFFF